MRLHHGFRADTMILLLGDIHDSLLVVGKSALFFENIRTRRREDPCRHARHVVDAEKWRNLKTHEILQEFTQYAPVSFSSCRAFRKQSMLPKTRRGEVDKKLAGKEKIKRREKKRRPGVKRGGRTLQEIQTYVVCAVFTVAATETLCRHMTEYPPVGHTSNAKCVIRAHRVNL